jgi:hypothetical protein
MRPFKIRIELALDVGDVLFFQLPKNSCLNSSTAAAEIYQPQ